MEAGIFPKRDCIAVPTITFRAKPSEVLVPLATSPSTTSTPLRMRRWSLMAGLFVHRWPTSCQGANIGPITSKNFVLRPPASRPAKKTRALRPMQAPWLYGTVPRLCRIRDHPLECRSGGGRFRGARFRGGTERTLPSLLVSPLRARPAARP